MAYSVRSAREMDKHNIMQWMDGWMDGRTSEQIVRRQQQNINIKTGRQTERK